jgi:DNA mismatch repair protein MutS
MATKTTPMMQQYQEIKSQYQDSILFFRLGDFYEMFFDDAELVARELQLTLTGRGKDETRMPMCGVPHHAADHYIQKLVARGYKIAICEQTEDPTLSKGLTKREVVKVITPGTVVDSELLQDGDARFLLSVVAEDDRYGIAFADAASGNLKATQVSTRQSLFYEINKISPAEIIGPQDFDLGIPFTAIKEKSDLSSVRINYLDKVDSPLALAAAGQLIYYLQENQKTSSLQFSELDVYNSQSYLYMDSFTRKNLELFETMATKDQRGSLFSLLNQTKTAMGRRLLKEWLTFPLLDVKGIEQRYQAVSELFNDPISREELRSFLKDIYDIERIITRLKLKTANAKDLISLKESLAAIEHLAQTCGIFESPLISNLADNKLSGERQQVLRLIDEQIVNDPPHALTSGGLIKEGVDQQIDELRRLSNGGKDWLVNFEASEKERTGIKSLKVGYNKVFGYYLEVTKLNAHMVPDTYIRKQTLTNAERYITPELKEKEDDILNAQTKLSKLEYTLFDQLRTTLQQFIEVLRASALSVSRVDVLCSLAEVAVNNNYCRPTISTSDNILDIHSGRHPVLEKNKAVEAFVPNDLLMKPELSFILLFGPNMSGKSTYMRQAAVLLLMAQIGSFVPADSMNYSLVDRIFTRVGASDDISSGQSTFMMEMSETAMILNNATENSFVILDEIGRGTSTYDGIAIAYSVSEYLINKIHAKTIFATHYHELSIMPDNFPSAKSMRVEVSEIDDQITFLHKVTPGSTDRSYGIHVAELAGLPPEVVTRSKQILGSFEDKINRNFQQLSLLDSV